MPGCKLSKTFWTLVTNISELASQTNARQVQAWVVFVRHIATTTTRHSSIQIKKKILLQNGTNKTLFCYLRTVYMTAVPFSYDLHAKYLHDVYGRSVETCSLVCLPSRNNCGIFSNNLGHTFFISKYFTQFRVNPETSLSKRVLKYRYCFNL